MGDPTQPKCIRNVLSESDVIDRVLSVRSSVEAGYRTRPQADLDLCSDALDSVLPRGMPAAPEPISREQLLQSLRSWVSWKQSQAQPPSSQFRTPCGENISAAKNLKGKNAHEKRVLIAASSVKQSCAISRFLRGSR